MAAQLEGGQNQEWKLPGLLTPLPNPRDSPSGILRALGALAEMEQPGLSSLVRHLATKSLSTLWTTIVRGEKTGKVGYL